MHIEYRILKIVDPDRREAWERAFDNYVLTNVQNILDPYFNALYKYTELQYPIVNPRFVLGQLNSVNWLQFSERVFERLVKEDAFEQDDEYELKLFPSSTKGAGALVWNAACSQLDYELTKKRK